MVRLLSVACIGSACAVLQPQQPQSAIATVLLIVALALREYPRRDP